ncbi:GntR family transcriptional regulator [Arthrobacter sp. KNU40]|uniref:GntR family transcriptional regulator n=1 Tax=Arthrobacter sp. KNU40 TaxID=3447965 RepID=UPI003F60C10F
MSITAAEAIDRLSTTPYYRQLFDVLERRIASKDIEAGERLPSENELCTEFGLSRATVRQALKLLESSGLAHRIPGRGVFASEPSTDRGWVIQGQQGFLENAIGHQNRPVTTQVLRSGPVVLPESACRSLELPEGTRGFELVRLRSLDGIPALYSINYSPPTVAAIIAGATEVLAGQASLSGLLASAGYGLGGANRTIRAVNPTPEIANALNVTDSSPLLRIQSTSWTTGGERFDVYETWVRSEIVPIEVNVSSVDLSTGR